MFLLKTHAYTFMTGGNSGWDFSGEPGSHEIFKVHRKFRVEFTRFVARNFLKDSRVLPQEISCRIHAFCAKKFLAGAGYKDFMQRKFLVVIPYVITGNFLVQAQQFLLYDSLRFVTVISCRIDRSFSGHFL